MYRGHMSKEPEEIPEEHPEDAENEHAEDAGPEHPEGPQPHSSIKDFPGGDGGMSLSRFEEIQDAEARGEPLDLSDEERAEYETLKTRMAEVMDSFRRTMLEPYQGINARLQEIVRGAIRPIKFDMPQVKLPGGLIRQHDSSGLSTLRIPEPPAPTPIVTDDDLEAMAEASRERDEVQTSIRKHTFETAAAMKAMLDEMERESKEGSKRWWWVFAVALLSMLLAGFAAGPVFVEIWRALFGD